MDQQASQPPGGPGRRDLRVLVADDEPLIGRVLEHMLTRRGHKVVSVGDAGAALRHLAAEPFDVVMVDSNMPGNGETVLEQLDRSGFEGRIFLMSGALDLEDLPVPPGVERLSKPFSFNRVVALLEGGRRDPR